jgi:WD40 repeat protein
LGGGSLAAFSILGSQAGPPARALHRPRHRGNLRSENASGRMVLSGGFDSTIRLWDTQTRAELSLDGHQGAITSLAFAPDGNTGWSGAEDGLVLVWDLSSGKARRLFPDPADPVTCIAFGNKRVALGTRSGWAVVIDRETERVLAHNHAHEGAITSMTFVSDDNLLTASGRPVTGEWLGDGSVRQFIFLEGRVAIRLLKQNPAG